MTITNDIKYVGVNDHKIDLFESAEPDERGNRENHERAGEPEIYPRLKMIFFVAQQDFRHSEIDDEVAERVEG